MTRPLRMAAIVMSVIVTLVGTGHLAAWLGGYMGSLGFSTITMKTNTSLCLTLSGLALLIIMPRETGGRRLLAGRILAAFVAVVGMLSLCENLIGWRLGIDQILASEPPGAMAISAPNRMGTPASLSFTLIGLGLLIASRRASLRTAQYLALAVCTIALLGSIGHLYGADVLYGIAAFTGIAWPTALSLLMLGLSLLLARPSDGLMTQVTAADPGGVNLRRWLPVLLLPVVLGYLRLEGERRHFFDPATGTAIVMILFIVVMALLAFTGSRQVSRGAANLSQQREWLQVTLGSIGDAVLATDLYGRVTFINPVAATLTGYKNQDAIGRAVDEVFHIINEKTRRKADIVGAVLRGGEAVALADHTSLITADGREVPIEDSAAPIMDVSGKVVGVVLVFHDVTVKRRAHEASALLATIVESTDDAIISKGLDGHVLSWNPGAERLFGYRAEEIVGRSINLLVPLDRMAEEEDILAQLRAGKPVDHRETVRVAKDGRRVDVAITASPLKDADGRIIGASKIARDITARKQAEDALTSSNERMKKVLEVETVGVMFWDLNTGCMTDANDTFLKLMGYSRAEVEARELTWQKLTPPEYVDVSLAEIRKFQASGRIGPYEKEYFRKDGTRQWLVFAGSSLGNNACVEFCVDISDRKKAEAALRASEERLSRLNTQLEQRVAQRTAELVRASEEIHAERQRLFGVLETVPAMVCLLTPDYHVAFANRSFRQRFGESNGRRCYEYCFGKAEPCDFCESYQVLKTGNPHRWEVHGSDGSVIEAHDYPFTDADGSPMILEMDMDMTEVRKAQAALQEAKDTLEVRVAERTAELTRSNAELEQFAYICSHDLQEPLRQVMSFGSLLEDRYGDKLDDRAKQYIQFMTKGSRRMSNLVRGLLDYSLIGRADQVIRPVSADEALNRAIQNLQSAIQETGASVTRESLLIVMGEPVQLGQLFQNLIGNAIKFRREGVKPEIHVGCKADGSVATFWVKDNGIGIPQDQYEKALVIFQRVHGDSKYLGTGIGLAICKKIVEHHGGRIWIESTVGEGSTFFFTVPLAPEAKE